MLDRQRTNIYRSFITLLLVLLVLPIGAATYTVTEVTDNGTGVTVGSLSWAITQSNASTAVDDTLNFNLSSSDMVTISAALPDITDSVSINGTNADSGNPMTIQVTTPGTSGFRVFEVNANGETVNISNMTLRGGSVGGNNGGCVLLTNGNLNVDAVVLSDGVADYGGGISAINGTLTITDSTFSNLTANDYGGCLYLNSIGSVSVNNSTFDGNTAGSAGAMLCLDTPATISNCTFHGNTSSAGLAYGVIYLFQSSSVTMSNCTIAGNSCPNSSDTYSGVYVQNTNVTLRNCILANNTCQDGPGDFSYDSGTVTDGGYNVVEYSNTAAVFNNPTSILYNYTYTGAGNAAWNQNGSDLANQNLNLAAALADNGGPNQTLALNTGSFAIDAIPYSAGTNTWNNSPMSGGNYYDQRGTEHVAGQSISIGAYSEPSPPTKAALSGPDTVRSGALTYWTLTSLDDSDNPAAVDQDTVFDLSSDSAGTATFYSDAAGATPITQLTISNGSSEATFYYLDDTFGTPVITAAQSSGMSLGSANKQIAIRGDHALNFDGTDDYVAADGVCAALNNPSAFSMECWIKIEAIGDQYFLAFNDNAKANDIQLGVDASLVLKIMRDGSTVGGSTLALGTWYHVALTVAADDSFVVYLNGVSDITGTVTERPASDGYFSMGQEWDGGGASNFFNGSLDEVRVWDDVRTQSEIRGNMHRQLTGAEANLAAYYKLDKGTGTTAFDATANGSDGTLTNDPAWQTSGAFAGPGNAMDFDGTDDYVNCGNDASVEITGTALTLEAWIHPDTFAANYWENSIIDKTNASGQGYVLRCGGSGVLDINFGDGASWHSLQSPTGALSANEWQHVAGVYDGANLRLFVNGVEVASAAETANITNANVNMRLGNGEVYPTRLFDGQVDEVRIWSTARSAAEIQDNMCRTLSGYEPGLAAYYRFDQQAVALQLMAYDQTPNANNGLLQAGMDTASWVASAAFNTWIGAESGLSSTAANWGAGVVPGVASNVGIPDYSDATGWPAANAIDLAADSTINTLQLSTNAAASVSANITVNGNAILNNDLNVAVRTVQVNGTTLSNGTLSISTGSFDANGPFDASAGAVTFTNAGDLYLADTVDLGTFTAGTGTVTLDGASQTITGSNTFYNLIKTVTSAATLTFDAGANTVVQNILILQGAAGELLSLRSSSPGTDWNLDPQDTRSLAYLHVQDSNNINATVIDVRGQNCSDSGNNTNWRFVDTPPVLTLSDAPTTFTENGSAVVIDSGLTITDADGDTDTLEGASVMINSGLVTSEDVLAATDAHGITSSYNSANGVLTLTGTATVAEYQEVLRSVTYSNSNTGDPDISNRVILFQLGTGVFFTENNHFYEFISGAYTWAAAEADAENRDYMGLQGYLVTITSAEENAFAYDKLDDAGWIGASDAASEGTWRWVTGPEGLEDGGQGRHFFTQTASGSGNNYAGATPGGGVAVNGYYHNWYDNGSDVYEPNDWGDDEDYAHLQSGDGEWNDWPGTITPGYVVEYGGMPSDPTLQITGSTTVTVQAVNYAPVILETYTHTYVDKWGMPGVDPGTFVSLNSVAADSSGNVYTVENGNRVQKFDSSGAFIREWGGDGSGDGQFNAPRGVAVDASGNVYVADTFNSRIQKFDENGNFLDKFGSSGSGNGEFAMPYDVAVDASGNVYVADTSNSRIQKFDSAGNYVTQWGSFGTGDGQFYSPRGVALDGSGNVYVTDLSIARVQKFDSSGTYLGQWGSSGSGEGQFNSPWGIAVSASGLVYVTDASIDRVQAFDLSGNYHSQWGSSGSGDGQISSAFGITVDASGYVYIAESGNARIQKFSPPTGVPIGASTAVTMSEDGSPTAFGLTLFATDADGDTLTWNLSSAASYGTAGVTAPGTGSPMAITYEPDADFAGTDSFVVEINDGNGGTDTVTLNVTVEPVQDAPVIDQGTSISVTMSEDGSPTAFSAALSATDPDTSDTLTWGVSSPATNGTATVSGTGSAPTTLTYAPDADWYGSDSFDVQVGDGQATDTITVNVTVESVNDAPVLATSEAGYDFEMAWGESGAGNGQFLAPSNVAVDSAGNIYVAESGNNRIQKFDASGAYLDQWGTAGTGDGQFNNPIDIVIDSSDTLYVLESSNNRVQKFDASGNFLTKWGSFGTGDGQFRWPYGLCVDASGDVYVADSTNYRIQKFDSNGVFLAKWGTQGTGDGEFDSPYGVAVDALGNIYVAESQNNRVQKFDPAFNFLSKWGASGFADGAFSLAIDLAIDDSGNVYVLDHLSIRLQKFDSSGAFLSKWGGNGTGDGQFDNPLGMGMDADGNIYVADSGNDRIQKFAYLAGQDAGTSLTVTMSEDSSPTAFDLTLYATDAEGDMLTWNLSSAASYGTAGVTAPGTGSPMAITYAPDADYNGADSFLVEVSDGNGGTDAVTVNVTVEPVQDAPVIDQGASISVTMSEDGSPTAFNATLSATDPDTSDTLTWSVSSAASNGTAMVSGTGAQPTTFTYAPLADWSGSDSFEVQVGDGQATDTITVNVTVETVNDAPVLLTSASRYAYSAKWGSNGTGDGELQNARGVAVDSASGAVYVADSSNHRIQKFDAEGNFVVAWGQQGSGDGDFLYPLGVAVDSAGNVYVADSSNNRVQKFNSNGNFLLKWGYYGTEDGRFHQAMNIAVDSSDNVYVTDLDNDRIQKFDSSGNFLLKWGSEGTGDGQFNRPYGIATAPSGDVYVVDMNNDRVQQFASDGTFIRTWGSEGTGDGQFSSPLGVTVDASGRVYVAGYHNHRVQQFSADGVFLYKWGGYGTEDGQLWVPHDVAIDDAGKVYVMDTGNNRIQVFTYEPGVEAGASVDVTMSEDSNPTAFDLTLYANDVEGDTPLTWNLSSAASYGTAGVTAPGTGSPMAITYAPDADYNGADSFAVQVSDGNGGTDAVTVNVIVEAVNDAPVIDQGDSISVTMSENGNPTAFSATLSATDVDTSDTLTWNLSSAASYGTAVVSGTGFSPTTFDYTPDTDYSGADSFVVTVTDGTVTDAITVNVTVEPVNNAPVIDQGASLSVTMSEDGSPTVFSASLSATDADIGDTLTWNLSSAAYYGTAQVSGTGLSPTTFGYTPLADYNGSDSFVVSVSDGSATDAITIHVTVEASNDAPVLKTVPAGFLYSAKWGSEGSGDGQFKDARGIAVDDSGNVYVADSTNHRIQKFDSDGNFVLTWGWQGSGDGSFFYPQGIAVDASGNVYVADTNMHRVQKFDSSGNFLLKWGSNGTANGQFNQAAHIAVDASGNVYVTDLENHRVQKFDSSGNFLLEWGSNGTSDGQFNKPYGIATAPSGDVYVVDMNNDRIQQFTSTGVFVRAWGSTGSGNGQFSSPLGVTVDASGKVYVTEYYNNRVQQFTADGVFLRQWGGYGTGNGDLWIPYDVATDDSGKVYVMDTGNNRIQVFTYTTGADAGSSLSVSMSEDGVPTAWSAPTLSALDVDGDILTWSVATQPANGTATVSGTGPAPTTFDYAPDADWFGVDSFVVQVSDGTVSVEITVEVTVVSVTDNVSLTYLAGIGGTVDGASSVTQTLAAGDDGQAVTAIPYAGYAFVQWSDGRTDNPRIDTAVTTDTIVTANFAETTGTSDWILEYLLERQLLTQEQIALCDVNGNGKVTIADLVYQRLNNINLELAGGFTPVTRQATAPDLVLESLAVSPNPMDDITGGFAFFTVRNQGGTASAATEVRMEWSGKTEFRNIPALAPGGSWTTLPVRLGHLDLGVQTLTLLLDAPNIVPEADETNNSRSADFQVELGARSWEVVSQVASPKASRITAEMVLSPARNISGHHGVLTFDSSLFEVEAARLLDTDKDPDQVLHYHVSRPGRLCVVIIADVPHEFQTYAKRMEVDLKVKGSTTPGATTLEVESVGISNEDGVQDLAVEGVSGRIEFSTDARYWTLY